MICNNFKNIFGFFKFILQSFLLFTILPIILLIILPFAIYRKIIFNLAPILKPRFGKMLTMQAIPYALGHKNPKYPSVNGEMEFDGVLDLEEMKADWTNKVINLKKHGHLVYPELRQIWTEWMGHLFWKNVPNFSVDNHFHWWTKSRLNPEASEEETRSDLNRIRKEIMMEDYAEGRPYWIIYFVPNPRRNSTIVFIKHQHAYFDGFSLLKLMSKVLTIEDPRLQQLQPGQRQKFSIISSIYLTLLKLIKTPKVFSRSIFEPSKTAWQKGLTTQDLDLTVDEIPMGHTNLITFAKLKEAAKLHQVGVSTIITTIICGAIRRYMLKNGDPIPRDASLTGTFAKPNHPDDKLRNYHFGTSISLPIGQQNPLERLKIINNRKISFRNSFAVHIQSFLFNLPNCLPTYFVKIIIKYAVRNPLVSFNYAGTPGPKGNVSWRGHLGEIKGFFAPSFAVGFPLFIYSMNNQHGILFYLTGVKSVFRDDEGIKELANFFEDELELLLMLKSYPEIV